MAHHEITHTCGHTTMLRLHRTERWRIDRESDQPCFECVKQQRFILARAEAIMMGLPELTGTPKQIAWATTIRGNLQSTLADTIADILYKCSGDSEAKSKVHAILEEHALHYLRLHTTARWWIDEGRGQRPQTILRGALGTLREQGVA